MGREKIFRALSRLDAAIARAQRAIVPDVVLMHYRNSPDRCFYCGLILGDENATLDHIKPKSRGGTRAIGNLVPACSRCNGIKGSIGVNSPRFRSQFPGGKFWAEAEYKRALLL